MMKGMDLLLIAKTDAEFFVILCNLLRSVSMTDNLRPELKAVGSSSDQYALELSIKQTLVLYPPTGGTAFVPTITHIFNLSRAGVLTWQMKDQPLLTGVVAIQAALERFWQSIDVQALPDTTSHRDA